MTYQAIINTSVQAISDDQGWSSLLKFNQSALQVGGVFQTSLNLVSGVISTVDIPNLTRLQVLTIKATQPVDISLRSDGSDLFMGLNLAVIVLVEPDGVIFDHLKLRSLADSSVELSLGGLPS